MIFIQIFNEEGRLQLSGEVSIFDLLIRLKLNHVAANVNDPDNVIVEVEEMEKVLL